MKKSTMLILLTLSVLLAACAPAGTPTMSAADVEGTAMSAAWTVVAATQQAIPTATLVPPTETPSPTPQPTFTPLAPPTFPFSASPTAVVSASGTDNCLHPINMGEAGRTKRLRIENNSGGTIAWLSLNLRPNLWGQCGAMSWSSRPGYWKEIVNVPTGTWWAVAALELRGGKSTTVGTGFSLGVGQSDDITVLDIQADKMLVHFP